VLVANITFHGFCAVLWYADKRHWTERRRTKRTDWMTANKQISELSAKSYVQGAA